MKALKITIEHDDGSVWYIDNPVDIRSVGLSLPKNIAWKKGAGIIKLRNLYFRMLTEITRNVETGYSKLDLHESLRPMLFGKMQDFPQYFKEQKFSTSTGDLNREGWMALIEQLKVTANDIFGYTFA